MIGKLATRDGGTGRQFKPQILQGRGRGQNKGNYDKYSYDQQSYQNRYRSDSGDRRQFRQDRGRPIGEVISEVKLGILTDRIVEESIEILTGTKVMTEAEQV